MADPQSISIGVYLSDVEETLADLEQRNVVGRIWHSDYTVWKPDPAEISNRLGWLDVADLMHKQVRNLEDFAGEVRDAGFAHVVLLGMGGSSLGPEVLRQTFGSAAGYPRLIVLDSTLPEAVQAVTDAIKPAQTLFIVSSKSGGTTEPNVLFQYFKSLVEPVVGKENAGKNFIAITDAGSSLAGLAQAEGFRRTFENPSDIGGRYSVLSYFGLVPAALCGINISALLAGADRMREGCLPYVPIHECFGAWLGACMGTLTLLGRDKLTLLTSPAIASFGLWVEQLLAESTGKEGKGIVPVAGEPVMEKEHYGRDRFFVCLRLDGDDNSVLDAAVENIKSYGQPVVLLEMRDKTDIGAEFYRWEFATAIAGAILGIHPFDQPDVQAAKDATERVLQEYVVSGNLPKVEEGSLAGLLAQAEKGKYLAILAYLCQTPETDRLLTDLRRRIVVKYNIATTLGYGPRYLHSTGQLHKGGPDTGLFLQLSSNHGNDIDIPGKPYSFGIVADAQALGDFQALQMLGRHVTRIHIDGDINTAISKLLKALM